MQIADFVPWLYDVGAEIIHGSETILNDIHKKQGWPTREVRSPRANPSPNFVAALTVLLVDFPFVPQA